MIELNFLALSCFCEKQKQETDLDWIKLKRKGCEQ